MRYRRGHIHARLNGCSRNPGCNLGRPLPQTLESVQALTARSHLLLSPDSLQRALDTAAAEMRKERLAAFSSIEQLKLDTMAYVSSKRAAALGAVDAQRQALMVDITHERVASLDAVDVLRKANSPRRGCHLLSHHPSGGANDGGAPGDGGPPHGGRPSGGTEAQATGLRRQRSKRFYEFGQESPRHATHMQVCYLHVKDDSNP